MDTHFNSPSKTPDSPLNSPSSSSTTTTTTTTNPNSPLQTLSPSPSDFDGLSPLSDQSTPEFDPPDPDYDDEYEDDDDDDDEDDDCEVLSCMQPCSIYSWRERWSVGQPFRESRRWEPPVRESRRMSFSEVNEWNNSSSELVVFKPPAEKGFKEWGSKEWPCRIGMMEPKPDVLEFFPDNKPFPLGAGLANLGNTCFLNSIMQCFIHTVPLIQGLFLGDHKSPCERFNENFCVICVLHGLVGCSLISTGGIVSPWKLVDNLSYISSCFQRYQQEDAHEFLQCFLDKLESCSNDSASSESVNIVKNVFGGRLVSKLRCCNCSHCSDTYEPSIDLSLEIGDVDTLVSALESFTKVEKIEDAETQFTCENCKEKVSVEKQLLLDQAPSVAAFHLKRFKSDGSYVEKIDKYVQFPQELDLLPYTSCSQADDNVELKYELFAVVVHTGYSSTSGHYYCFIRSSPDAWYKFDDSMVVRVREEHVLSQEAYILFYAKQGTPSFSSFIESQKPLFHPTTLNTSPKSVLDGVGLYSTYPRVLNNFDCDVIETSNTAEEAAMEIINQPEENKLEGSEAIDDSIMKPTLDDSSVRPTIDDSSVKLTVDDYSVKPTIDDSFVKPSHKDEPVKSPSVLKENCSPKDDSFVKPTHKDEQVKSPSVLKENCSPKFGKVSKASNIILTTPPRSPSPGIYKEDPSEDVFSIPRGHLRLVDQVPCNQKVNTEMEDRERKEACLLLKKRFPGSRAQQLMAAMRGSYSEGSINKKRSRITEISSTPDNRNSAARRRSVGPGARILAAGTLR